MAVHRAESLLNLALVPCGFDDALGNAPLAHEIIAYRLVRAAVVVVKSARLFGRCGWGLTGRRFGLPGDKVRFQHPCRFQPANGVGKRFPLDCLDEHRSKRAFAWPAAVHASSGVSVVPCHEPPAIGQHIDFEFPELPLPNTATVRPRTPSLRPHLRNHGV